MIATLLKDVESLEQRETEIKNKLRNYKYALIELNGVGVSLLLKEGKIKFRICEDAKMKVNKKFETLIKADCPLINEVNSWFIYLTEMEKKVLFYRYIDLPVSAKRLKSLRDVAEILECDEKTIRNHEERAINKILKIIKKI